MAKIVRRIVVQREIFELQTDEGVVLRPVVLETPIRRATPKDYLKALERHKSNWAQLEGQLAKEMKQAQLQGIDWEAKMLAELEAAETEQPLAPILGLPATEGGDDAEEVGGAGRDDTSELPFGVEELETIHEPVVIEQQEIRRRGRPRKEEALIN